MLQNDFASIDFSLKLQSIMRETYKFLKNL